MLDVLRRARGSLRRLDPGLERSLHALKTVAAVVLALGVRADESTEARLFAGLGAGLVMQCATGASRRTRLATMAGAGLAMMAAAELGSLTGGHAILRGTITLAAAFLTFWIRRFLPAGSTFPLFVFVVLLFSTALPGGAAEKALGLGAGGAIAVAVELFAPPRPLQAFADDLRVVGEALACALRALAECAKRRQSGLDLHELRRALAFTDARAASLPPGAAPPARSILARLREAEHALTLLARTTPAILAGRGGIDLRRRACAEALLRSLAELFAAPPSPSSARQGAAARFAEDAFAPPRLPARALADLSVAAVAARRLEELRAALGEAVARFAEGRP